MKHHEPHHIRHGAETPHKVHKRPLELGEEPRHSSSEHDKHTNREAVETARHIAISEALADKEQDKERRARQADRHNAAQHHITHTDRDISFEQTMDEVRTHLPRSTRRFSRFVHRPMVERISDVVGKTIGRPHAILAGGVSAFVAVLSLYFYAKYAGFALQGSETIIAFTIGWALGMLFDFFMLISARKR